MASYKDKAEKLTTTIALTKALSSMALNRATASTFGRMEPSTKVASSRTRCKAKVSSYGEMVKNMRAIG